MTQLEAARQGKITAEMRRVAVRENVTPEMIRGEDRMFPLDDSAAA